MKTVNYQQATKQLNQGKVGVIPTDTVYGLCARAGDKSAVQKMYQLKSRGNKPGTLIAADIIQLVGLGIKKRYLTAVENYWPGPISIIIPTGPVLNYLHLGRQSLAVRVPKNAELQELLTQTGPLITTSANLPGQPPAENIEQTKKYFGDIVDFFVDGGMINNQSSTIIRVVDDAVEVVREGSVKVDKETGRIIT